jgi:hypothetical protein
VPGSDFTITYTSVAAPITGSSSPRTNSLASRSSTLREATGPRGKVLLEVNPL